MTVVVGNTTVRLGARFHRIHCCKQCLWKSARPERHCSFCRRYNGAAYQQHGLKPIVISYSAEISARAKSTSPEQTLCFFAGVAVRAPRAQRRVLYSAAIGVCVESAHPEQALQCWLATRLICPSRSSSPRVRCSGVACRWMIADNQSTVSSIGIAVFTRDAT
jgi:hypothetical protein